MHKIPVNPGLFKQLGETQGCHFRLLTNNHLRDNFSIDKGTYESGEVATFDTPEEFEKVVADLPRPVHILVISLNSLFEAADNNVMGKQYKLLTLPCSSTDMELDDIRFYLEVMERTDIDAQQEWSNRFFDISQQSKYLKIIDVETKTEAIFHHLSDQYEWFEQLGILPWEGQQFVPSGEISVFSLFHDQREDSYLNVNGEITFSGYPIINSGRTSFLKEDRRKIYEKISSLMKGRIIFEVEKGRLNPKAVYYDKEAEEAYTMFQSLFEVDSRYKRLWEIGFGSNTNMEVILDNRTPNEVYGHKNGCIHWGLGLTPRTQYHLDIICPNTIVVNEKGTVIVGGEPQLPSMKRKTAAGCPCIT